MPAVKTALILYKYNSVYKMVNVVVIFSNLQHLQNSHFLKFTNHLKNS